MTPYAYTDIFHLKEIALFDAATSLVNNLPDGDQHGAVLRCHEVARVVGRILKLPVQDGFYGYVEHSWCWTHEPRVELNARTNWPNILDPYVPGKLPCVQLVDTSPLLPHSGVAYRPGLSPVVREDVVEYLFNYLKQLQGKL